MFQLIVAVISIVLVAALALAATYYGGDVFVSSRTRTMAQALLEQSNQIKSAYILYRTENGSAPTTIDQMVLGGYLKPISFPYAGYGTSSVQGRWDIQNWGGTIMVMIAADGAGSYDGFETVCNQAVREVNGDPDVPDLRGHGIRCYYTPPSAAVFGRYIEGN